MINHSGLEHQQLNSTKISSSDRPGRKKLLPGCLSFGVTNHAADRLADASIYISTEFLHAVSPNPSSGVECG
jgi:hypothetical protein